MLTNLRYFGAIFNPVTFYYCYTEDDCSVETIVAEITNTPWGERHAYVLPASRNQADGAHHRYHFDKEFHVSPFLDMDYRYDWRFNQPGRSLSAHFENHRNGSCHFDATLSLTRREISPSAWEALRLWWKGVRFYSHPKHKAPEPMEAIS
jgi:DUF1365 family protein